MVLTQAPALAPFTTCNAVVAPPGQFRLAPVDLAASSAVSGTAFEAMAKREQVSDRYWSQRDPIKGLRLFWRAQTSRHLFHILPGETILELGCGSGGLSRALGKVTRGQCPIHAASFNASNQPVHQLPTDPAIEWVQLRGLPGELRGRTFDYVVASNLLDADNAAAILKEVQQLLRPGGRPLFFYTNPWNPVFLLRKRLSRWLPFLRRGDERDLHNQVKLYELLSELGFIRIGATTYDFLYRPMPRWLMFIAKNLSLVLENTPGIRRLAGVILVQAQNPPG